MIRYKALFSLFLIILVASSFCRQAAGSNDYISWKKIHVLVYTKNGKGYVNDNIAAGVASIKQLDVKYGF